MGKLLLLPVAGWLALLRCAPALRGMYGMGPASSRSHAAEGAECLELC